MRRLSLMLLLLMVSFAAIASAASRQRTWPTLDQQIKKDRVEAGSPLERLIQDNQDFRMLRPEEATDKIPVPLWLRVYWRKGHPEGRYTADDPTGGYPHVLKEIHEWMLTHQDLRPNSADEPKAAAFDDDEKSLGVISDAATVGGNTRISGLQTVPRSESDIRINFWNPLQIVAASNNIGGSGQ